MARAIKARWGERLYGGGHGLLRRSRMDGVVDYRWCEVLLSERTLQPPSGWDKDSLWMGEARAAQLEWLAAFAPERAGEFPARWAEGRRCFAAALRQDPASKLEPKCVGYLWVALGPTRLASRGQEYVWDIPEHAGWMFDALFHPLVLGTYPDLVRFTSSQLRREGFGFMLGQVEYDNRVSRRVHRMLGAERLGWIATVAIADAIVHLDRSERGSWAVRWGRTPVPLTSFLPAAGTASERSARAA